MNEYRKVADAVREQLVSPVGQWIEGLRAQTAEAQEFVRSQGVDPHDTDAVRALAKRLMRGGIGKPLPYDPARREGESLAMVDDTWEEGRE